MTRARNPIRALTSSSIDARIAAAAALAAWAALFLRQYLHVAAFERVPPLVPAALSLAALAAIARTSLVRSTKTLLAVVCVLTIAAGIVLTAVRDEDKTARDVWRKSEEREISSVLDAVRDRVESLLELSASIGDSVEAVVGRSAPGSGAESHGTAGTADHRPDPGAADSVGARLNAFRELEALSEEIAGGGLLPAGTEIGIQIFDAEGKRWAWAGWPQALDARDRRFVASGRELIYSRQASLYQMLTHVIPIEGGDGERRAPWGAVLVDIPLEVNYRVNNKFLKSSSLADDIAKRAKATVLFEYLPVDPALADTVSGAKGRVAMERVGALSGTDSGGLSGRAVVRSPLGTPLFDLVVDGRPFQHFVQARNDRLIFASNLAILLALLVCVGLSFRAFPEKWSGPSSVFKALYVVVCIALVRYALVWFQPDVLSTKAKVFEPAVFATPILGGLMRSAGDLLITAVFFVAARTGRSRSAAGPARAVRGPGAGHRCGSP
jgi:hypothetical protein